MDVDNQPTNEMRILVFGSKTFDLEKFFKKLKRKKAYKDLAWSYVTEAPAPIPQKIDKLLPLVERKMNELLTLSSLQGFALRVTSGFRSFAEQDTLYAQGRTLPGNIVTNARGGESLHNYGCAFDVVDRYKGYNIDWAKLGALGKSLGLEWGGDWKSFVDKPHFQIMNGYALKDFQQSKVDLKKYV